MKTFGAFSKVAGNTLGGVGAVASTFGIVLQAMDPKAPSITWGQIASVGIGWAVFGAGLILAPEIAIPLALSYGIVEWQSQSMYHESLEQHYIDH